MEYKKIETTAYKLHTIKTEKFKTISFKINFKNKVKKEDITKRNLLSKIMLISNTIYKDRILLEQKCEDLYGLNIGIINFISGNYLVTSINGIFLNEKYTEANMNEESFKFIMEIILNADITEESLDLAKRMVKDEIDEIKDNPKYYSEYKMLQNMGDDSISYNSIGYLEDLNIDVKTLKDYYFDLINKDIIDIFVIGEVDNIKKIIDNYLKINTLKKPSESHYYIHNNIRKRAKYIKETKKFEQSNLVMGFKLENLTEFEQKYVMSIYSYILGGGADSKLFQNVREKNSLCYSISSIIKPVFNIMEIKAGINKENYKKCINLIKKEIDNMKKGKFTLNDINSAIITYINTFKEIEDNQGSILKIYESSNYLGFDELEKRIKEVSKVTKNDIINISKKIHLDTVFLLEGDLNV